jgi:hypothetical protein
MFDNGTAVGLIERSETEGRELDVFGRELGSRELDLFS